MSEETEMTWIVGAIVPSCALTALYRWVAARREGNTEQRNVKEMRWSYDELKHEFEISQWFKRNHY
jgi:hypothetical protein